MHPQTEKIIANIREKLKEGKWDAELWSFVTSKDMVKIIEQLIEVREHGHRFVPSLADAMTPFALCKPNKVKCVIITSLKSNNVVGTKGNKAPMQPTTWVIEKVLETAGRNFVSAYEWAYKEGVLQISTAMTSTIGGEHHYVIWKPWVAYLINKVNDLYPDTPVIMVGAGAKQYQGMIRSPHQYIVDTWPIVDAHNCWKEVNKLLISQGKKEIYWVTQQKYKAKQEKWAVRNETNRLKRLARIKAERKARGEED